MSTVSKKKNLDFIAKLFVEPMGRRLAVMLVLGLGLDITGLVNNHCHVYHVIINCVSVTITITISTTPRFLISNYLCRKLVMEFVIVAIVGL